jgi:hypothetical protein
MQRGRVRVSGKKGEPHAPSSIQEQERGCQRRLRALGTRLCPANHRRLSTVDALRSDRALGGKRVPERIAGHANQDLPTDHNLGDTKRSGRAPDVVMPDPEAPPMSCRHICPVTQLPHPRTKTTHRLLRPTGLAGDIGVRSTSTSPGQIGAGNCSDGPIRSTPSVTRGPGLTALGEITQRIAG